MSYLGTVGTAGHIDHGKTTLVKALTGVDTDRLAEEKARGITIELGFAELDLGDGFRAGVVDVPGHEGFVRTMVAGASGVDVGLLVVAADEGVMPQTTEHLAILRFLGVSRLVVALTKCDTSDEEWTELVEEDVRSLLDASPWPGSPVLRTSARDGVGLDPVRTSLREVLLARPGHSSDDIARLPVDRVFTIHGTGTVATGTLWSGALESGARLFPRPGSGAVRVRGLEVHGQKVARAGAGQRTALAVTGDTEHVLRGRVLTTLESWEPSHRLTAHLALLPDAAPLERGRRVRVHIGTAEIPARVLPLHGPLLDSGGEGWVELRLAHPMLARTGDRLVLRSLTPVRTIGGGQVVEPHPPRRSRRQPISADALQVLLSGSAEDRVSAILKRSGREGVPEPLVPVRAGVAPPVARSALGALEAATRGGRAFHPDVLSDAEDELSQWVGEVLSAAPLAVGAPLEGARALLGGGDLAELAIERLQARGVLEGEGGWLRPVGYRPDPSPQEQQRLDRFEEAYRSVGLEAPAVTVLAEEIGEDDPWPLAHHLVRTGRLARIDESVYLHAPVAEAVRSDVLSKLGGRKGLGPMDFKEVIPVSRRHLLPILGYLDRLGVTRRTEGGREVG